MALNKYVLRGAVVGALGGLLFGFDSAVISGTQSALTHLFSLSPGEWGLTVSIALWGTVIGAISAGPLESRYGARAMLRVMGILYIVSALGCALAPSWGTFMVARLIGGLGIGGSSVLGPVYIAEIAPARLRGRLVGMFQVNIVIGVLLAYLSNTIISRLNLGATEWRWEFGVATLPAVLFMGLLYFIPRSARWLVGKGHTAEAEGVLRTIGEEDPIWALAQIQASIDEERASSSEGLFQRKYKFPIMLAIGLAMFNQLSGINAIWYYLNDLFVSAGYDKMSSNLQAVAVASVNLIATLIGMSLIDKIGRRTLLLIGAVGTAPALAGVAYVYYSHSHNGWLLPLLLWYIAFFACSQGAVIWVYLSEIFPTLVRGKGQGLGSSTHWVMNAIISFAFPWVGAHFTKGLPFAFFAVMTVVQFFVVQAFFPETKGVSLEELQHKLGIEGDPSQFVVKGPIGH